MRVTTIDEARQLVGHTFERYGRLWTVVRAFRNLAVEHDYVELLMTGEDVVTTLSLEAFLDWLSVAKEVSGSRLNDDWLHEQGGKWDMDGACWRFRHSWNTVNVRVNGQCWITASCTYGGDVSLHRRLVSCEEFSELCRLLGMPLTNGGLTQ